MTIPVTKTIFISRIKLPEINLRTRDAHKLRGYFGDLFKEYSPLLHNHSENGDFRCKYPSMQYKVIGKTPILIGIGEGAELLPQLFLKIKEINTDGKTYPVQTKNIEVGEETAGFSHTLIEYRFETLWMALNQMNYRKYYLLKDEHEKQEMLNSIPVGHVLSFFRNMNIELGQNERLMATVDVKEKSTNFKENEMVAFSGSFIVNALLPESMGLGKSAARGFGTISRYA